MKKLTKKMQPVYRTVEQVKKKMTFICSCMNYQSIGLWAAAHLSDPTALPLIGVCKKCGAKQVITK